MTENLVEIFTTGVIMGNTVCMLSSCAVSPMVLIASGGDGAKRSLQSLGIFSLARIAAYVFLGVLAGVSGLWLNRVLGSPRFDLILGTMTGITLITVGIFIILDRVWPGQTGVCHYTRNMVQKGYSLALMGVLLALLPCVPLTTLLAQTMAEGAGPGWGAMQGGLFGIGITLSVPFWLFGLGSGALPARILQDPRTFRWFRLVCGALMIIIGTRYMLVLI